MLGKLKDEVNTLIMNEFLALNPKVYSIIHQDQDKTGQIIDKNKKTMKGVSKAVVKKEITHKDYKHVIDTNNPLTKNITSIRSFNHQLYTYKQPKVALTSFYDKMKMVDAINCVPFGYKNMI